MSQKTLERTSIGKGQSIVRAFPIDKSTAGTVGDTAGARNGTRKFGGSDTNVAHSLGGATANQKGPR
jgi:hypothetical protein